MRLYWKERRAGLSLVVADEDGQEVEVGAIRRTPRGYDAFATATGYDPGRATKGIATIEEARAFVESFHPWDVYGGAEDLAIEPNVQGLEGQDAPPTAIEPTETPTENPGKEGEPRWKFWKRE